MHACCEIFHLEGTCDRCYHRRSTFILCKLRALYSVLWLRECLFIDHAIVLLSNCMHGHNDCGNLVILQKIPCCCETIFRLKFVSGTCNGCYHMQEIKFSSMHV